MQINIRDFGLGSSLISLTNSKNQTLTLSNYGARVVDWLIPTNNGIRNIILGFNTAQEYRDKDSFQGATIGPVAGRIKNGTAVIANQTYHFKVNDSQHTLHGGTESFDKKLWTFEVFEKKEKVGVHFYLVSNDGTNGFPGQLSICVTHSFDEEGNWEINYQAQSYKDTIFNPTGHVYFNLTGHAGETIEKHELSLESSNMVELKEDMIPTGNLIEITGTVLDCHQPRLLKEIFESNHSQVEMVSGLDHPFLLDHPSLNEEQASLSLEDIKISVFTDRPAIVIFTANFGDKETEYRGQKGVHHNGITFETQVSPGAEQFEALGDINLKAGQIYQSTTIYKIN